MQIFARTQPKQFAEKLRDREDADGKEAYEFLLKVAPLPPLKWSPGLAKGARDHANDIGSKGVTGHKGTDGSILTDRINRYGKWGGACAENCSFGPPTGETIIIQLIVDEHTPSRGHRETIFNPAYCLTGIAFGPHAQYEHCCILDYAGRFDEK